MPPVIAAAAGSVALAAFNAGVPLAVANAIVGVGVAGAVLHTAVSTALTIGASYAVAKLTAPPAPKPTDGQIEFKQPVPARYFTYGNVKISGPILLLETTRKAVNPFLNKINAFGAREVATFQTFFINGEPVPITPVAGQAGVFTTGNIFVSGSSHGFVRLHTGVANQIADTALVAEANAQNPALWSTSHRLLSIPYAYAQLWSGNSPMDWQNVFPNGVPECSAVCGVRVYDPRKDSTNGGVAGGMHRMGNPASWDFSDNAALCALDWLTWKDGYDKEMRLEFDPANRIDWPSWRTMANICDQAVPLKAGGTERRYRVATRVSLDEPKSRVLHRLLQAGDMQLYTTAAGTIGVRGGRWVAPTTSIAVEETMLEAFFTHGVPAMERVNEYELTCMLPERDYAEVELAPWTNKTDTDYKAGIVRRQRLDLNQVPSNSQAQRLAKIYMSKRNPKWTGQVRTNFGGLNALGEATVSLVFAELDVPAGTFNGPFWIDGQISFLPDRTGVTFPVASADPTAYDWNAATEEQPLPAEPSA